jgi:hypothetical protein
VDNLFGGVMNIGKTQLALTVLLLILLMIVGSLGYRIAGGARQEATRFREDTLRKLQYSAQLNAYQAEAYARALRVIETEDPARQQVYWGERVEYRAKIDSILKEYEQAIPSDSIEERRAFNNFVETRKQYRTVSTRLVELATNGQAAVARTMIDTDLAPAYQNYTMAGDVLYDYEILTGNRHALELDRACTKAQFLTAFICIGVFLAGLMPLVVLILFARYDSPVELTH